MENLIAYKGKFPVLGENVYIAPGAFVIGDVTIGHNSSVWFNTVVRGDVHYVKIGEETNVQDQSVLHVTSLKYPLNIGNRVTIGHRAVVHGCTVGDECLIGMGAIILDGAHIEKHCLIAAGAVVTQGSHIPEGSMVAGVPAKVVRQLKSEEIEWIIKTAKHYINVAQEYMKTKYSETEKPVRGFLR